MSDLKNSVPTDVKNPKNDKKHYKKNFLKNVSVTTRETSITPNTEIALSYQNIYGNSKMLMYHHLLNEALLQIVIKNTIKFL